MRMRLLLTTRKEIIPGSGPELTQTNTRRPELPEKVLGLWVFEDVGVAGWTVGGGELDGFQRVFEEIVFEEAPEEEVVDEIFDIVEDQPEFPGGIAAFYKYVGKNMNYPKQARRMGIEGKVYVQFIVDKDGSVTNVRAVKGIGAGCDEEAERVLKSSPKFKPGKQRGRPVKVRMMMPIIFKLNN